MKKIALSLYLVLCCLSVWGQSTELRAKVVDLKTQQPLANATATIVNTNLSATTDLDGLFILADPPTGNQVLRSEEHTSELQSRPHLVCRLLLEKKNKKIKL